jgi:hypothetical protein
VAAIDNTSAIAKRRIFKSSRLQRVGIFQRDDGTSAPRRSMRHLLGLPCAAGNDRALRAGICAHARRDG